MNAIGMLILWAVTLLFELAVAAFVCRRRPIAAVLLAMLALGQVAVPVVVGVLLEGPAADGQFYGDAFTGMGHLIIMLIVAGGIGSCALPLAIVLAAFHHLPMDDL